MAGTGVSSENPGFIPDQNYTFEPPVKTRCISTAGGSGWTEKVFAEGWCLKFDPSTKIGTFQGMPVGEDVEHFFTIEFGPGSVAKEVSPPHLTVVK
ncbi:MAG: hypothetical protein WDN10_05345 [bacterium]